MARVLFQVVGGPRGATACVAALADRAEAERKAAELTEKLGVVYRVREVRW
jgi:hypothetical protein